MMLAIEGLSAGYAPGLAAVRGVDLTVGPGEVLGLVGESGSGKSTIAKVLLGMLPRGAWAAGSATLAGLELVGRAEPGWQALRGSRIGIVPQGAMGGLNPVNRIGTQLVEVVRLHTGASPAAAAARARELVKQVHLAESVLRAYPHQLSGGMRQRVAIALAVAGEPELVVADEPTTGLDLVTQKRVLDLLAELRSTQDMSMLVISHDLSGVVGIADRVAVMYAAKIVELRPAAGIRAGCAHPYTKGLLAASPSVSPDEPWSAIPGTAPPLDTTIPGCRFAPRCPLAAEQCQRAEPALVTHDGGEVACHRAAEPMPLSFPSVWTVAAADAAPRPPDPVEPLVRVTGLRLEFRTGRRTVPALRGVDLEIRRGEILGLVGESGSGKTTLARVLLGLVPPSAGRAVVNGMEITRLRGRRLRAAQRRIGFVHQDPYGSLHPAMTVERLVAEPLRLGGVPRPEHRRRVVAALDAAGLPAGPEFLDRLPARLSGGQRQRVAIARALVSEPILLVADEATSMLDVSTRAGIASTLRRLAGQRELAVLFVTHDLGEAMHACDRVLVLRDGEPVEVGPPRRLAETPAHPYTRELIRAGHQRAR
jgi:oligopeptide/dipeptide ABC transporter ATP-binding protein